MQKEYLISKLEIIKEILNPNPISDIEWAIRKLDTLIEDLKNEHQENPSLSSTSVASKPMKQYEYLSEILDRPIYDKQLNHYGNNGWELIMTLEVIDAKKIKCVFKREKMLLGH